MKDKPKDGGKALIKEVIESEVYKKHEERHNEKMKTVKRGENVVHIEYFKGILNDADLKEFALDLEKSKLELSSFDKSGVMYASLEDYTNMVYLALGSELTKNILYAAVGNVVWESIKLVTKKMFSKSKNQEVNSIQGRQITKKKVTFGIDLSLDKNTGFKFRLDSKFTTETIDKSLNQAKEFVQTKKPNEVYTHPCFLYYDHINEKWIPVDMMKDIKRKRLESQAKKKKIKTTKGKKENNTKQATRKKNNGI